MWLRRLLKELRIPIEESMMVFCDNQATISIAKNHVHYSRTKHVELDRHFIKEKMKEGILNLVHIPHLQVTDILTKALARIKFEELTSKLGMINIYSKLEGEC